MGSRLWPAASPRPPAVAAAAAVPAPAATNPDKLSEDSRHFLAAWKSWRGNALLPRRRDMDLVSIARLMPKLALLEVFSPQRAVFRLAGSDIEALLGMRLTGRDCVALAKPDYRAMRGRLLWTAASQPCAIVGDHVLLGAAGPSSPQAAGQSHRIESLTLPILPDDAEAPVQLLVVASHLPKLQGIGMAAPMAQISATQRFIDIGGGLPA